MIRRPPRYNISNFVEAIQNPCYLYAELELVGSKLNSKLHESPKADEYDDFMEESWDNLFILDGCRYDVYSQTVTDRRGLLARNSGSSESWEFMQKQFSGKDLTDTIYITSNPHATKLNTDTFFHMRNLLTSDWDEELLTVPPEKVAKETKKLHDKYPNKKIISHFMQPHYPFIGEKGQEFYHKGIMVRDKDEMGNMGDVWSQLRKGEVSYLQVWEAYKENLEIVLPHVHGLVDELGGLSVITADHGNLAGERLSPIPVRGYGHPKGIVHPKLQQVPWHKFKKGKRRKTGSDDPIAHNRMDSEKVQDRLQALGYVEE